MKHEHYINQLNEMYNEVYPNGVRLHYDKCKNECKYLLNFYRCRVGKDYGKQKIKILVVGKEPVFPKPYTGEKITYRVEEPCTMKDAGYNNHYLRTFYTVARLLMTNDEQPKSFYKNDMVAEKYENLRHCFAMTNYYKCVFTDDPGRSDKKTTKAMEKNCFEVLLKEISVLKPDVVILQGKGHATFWKKFNAQAMERFLTTVKYEKNAVHMSRACILPRLKTINFILLMPIIQHPMAYGKRQRFLINLLFCYKKCQSNFKKEL